MAIDPVCGMAVGEDATGIAHEHEGVTYRFCSAECRDKFVGDPTSFSPDKNGPGPDGMPMSGKRTNIDRATAYFRIRGMQSTACAVRIEHALEAADGVLIHTVNLTLDEAVVEYDAAVTTEGDVQSVIAKAGYVALPAGGGITVKRESRIWLFRISVGAVLSVLAVVANSSLADPLRLELLLPVAVVVHAYLGAQFYVGAIGPLFRGRLTADLLIVLGACSLLVYSIAAMFAGNQTYHFHTSVIVVTLVTFGRWLELAVAHRTADTVRRFLNLQPPNANVIRENHEERVPLSSVGVGDIVVVRPGAPVPTDGVVEEGHSTVDESPLTGTRLPARKSVGSQVWAGSVNREGVFRYRATRVGADTVLRQMAHIVQEAQESDAPTGRYMSGRTAKVFLPIVLVVAATAGIAWYMLDGHMVESAILHASAVALAAGPSALRIAERSALMEGIGLGVERGVLLRDLSTLDTMRRATCIVFDRVSGISGDVPDVTDVVPAAGKTAEDVLLAAAAALQEDDRPVANSLHRIADHRGFTLGELNESVYIECHGTVSTVDGDEILVGTVALMDEHGIGFVRLQHEIDRITNEKRLVVFVARNGEPVGLLAIAYAIRPLAAQTVATLKRMNLHTVMLSKGRSAAVRFAGEAAGVDEIVEDISTDRKVDEIHRLQQEGHTVIMVGAGVHDADTINEADLGIALASGTEVAARTGNVVLIGDEFDTVVYAISLGRRTVRKGIENMTGAVVYNLVAICMAAMGVIPPAAAALFAAAASVAVAANTLTLRQTAFIKNAAVARS